MKTKNILASTIALLMAFSIVGCGGGNGNEGDDVSSVYEWATADNISGVNVMDSSDISNYPGSHKMNLIAWNHTGNNDYAMPVSSNDVVTPEIERITGVKISEIVGNKGSNADTRYANLLLTGKDIDIAYGSGWINTEDVWDLTDYIDEYCPTIKARMPSYVWKNAEVNGGQEGKIFSIPYYLGSISLSALDPLADASKTLLFEYPYEYSPYIYVREDILKDAYPNAKTSAEIDALFKQNGSFTKEEIYDVEITSAQQFRTEFLPKIYNTIHNTKNSDGSYKYQITGNKWVEPMIVTAGSDYDTYDFFGRLVQGLVGAGGNTLNSVYGYWDIGSNKVESMFYQDFYKTEMYEWAKMVAEGNYISNTRMTSDHASILSEYNSGAFAIAYGSNSLPTGLKCQWNGETVKYRKVYLDIPFNEEHFTYFGLAEAKFSTVKIFKDSVSENELKQILRWLDFQCSRTADILTAWGPKTAGLYTINGDGNREYVDADLVNEMVYNTVMNGAKVKKYNLSNGQKESELPTFSFAYGGASIYHPKCVYDISDMEGLSSIAFNPAVSLPNTDYIPIGKGAGMQLWTDMDYDGVSTLWNKRGNIEDALKQLILSGASKSNFDSKWTALQNTLRTAGWTKQWFNTSYTNAFLTINADYADQFYE